jgi:hypothetical protein
VDVGGLVRRRAVGRFLPKRKTWVRCGGKKVIKKLSPERKARGKNLAGKKRPKKKKIKILT